MCLTRVVSLVLTLFPVAVVAQPWDFQGPVEVTSVQGVRVFHHLESSGRRNLAVSDQAVALAWEDERDGVPRVYLARKLRSASGFEPDTQVSGKGEAFEPAIAALAASEFVLAWEEDGKVVMRLAGSRGLSPIVPSASKVGAQPSLAANNSEIALVWSESAGRHSRIVLQRFSVGDERGAVDRGYCIVDAAPLQADQLYPSVAFVADRLVVVWEDRRLGHTIIMAAIGAVDGGCEFSEPQRISEQPKGAKSPYGKGHGVARAALAAYGRDGAWVVWADKRDYRHGYDIYGVEFSSAAGFTDNVRIQDDFGELARQWHATVAGDHRGHALVAWTDERDGNADVMLSWYASGAWSDDVQVPGASGVGEQSHPSIALDDQGNLHLAWVERKTKDGPTRLRYIFGRASED